MEHDKTVSAPPEARVQAPLDEGPGQTRGQRQKGRRAVDDERRLAPKPPMRAAAADDGDVEMTFGGRPHHEIRVQPLEMLDDALQLRTDSYQERSDLHLHADGFERFSQANVGASSRHGANGRMSPAS